MLKVMFCLVRLPHLTRKDFQDYWRDSHAKLVRNHATELGIRRYVQNHTPLSDETSSLQLSRGSPAGFDGVAELWWDSPETFAARSPAAVAAASALLADERTFIDLARSPIFRCQVLEIIEPDSPGPLTTTVKNPELAKTET
jgi:uncharacterized protein (TIGR02118 family)